MIPIVICFLVEKWKSHRLLCKALIKDEKEAKNVRKQRLERDDDKIPVLKIEIENLRSEIAAKNAELEEEKHNGNILVDLYEMKVIDEDGRVVNRNTSDDMR